MHRRFYVSLSLVSGLVLLAITLFAAYREVSPEWKMYQNKYKALLMEIAKDETTREKAKSLDVNIQQIYLSSLKRVDRCTSCHTGVENPLMANAEMVYRQHSGNYLKDHSVDRFGCTICHNGQGRAINLIEAHGNKRATHWDYPIIPMKYIQSSCAQCHDYQMLKQNGGEIVAKGEALFREKGCQGCHKLTRVGGVLGKVLDGVGSQPYAYFPMQHLEGEKTVYSWLKQHFDDPRAVVPDSEMKIDIKGMDSDLLTTYALTLKSEEVPVGYRRMNQIQGDSVKDGESLYQMYCIACHTTGKTSVYEEVFRRSVPAIMNPAFSKAIDDGLLKKIIEEGRKDTQMTAWKTDAAGLSEEEIQTLVKYITKNRPHERPESFGMSKYKGDKGYGEVLYGIRCAICHGAEGKGGEDLLGISLKNPIVQKEATPEFIAITVRDGREGTPMVGFGKKDLGLENQDIADVVAYVRTLSQKN